MTPTQPLYMHRGHIEESALLNVHGEVKNYDALGWRVRFAEARVDRNIRS